MKKKGSIIGLDIGTTKVCAVAGEVVGTELEIRGIGNSVSTGLKKGVITHIELTVESIRKAVAEAASCTGARIREIYVGIKGNHIRGIRGRGAIGITGKEISPLDLERVMESAKMVYMPLDREVLHVISTGYTVDGQNGIKYPVGMSGVRLEANVHIITGALSPIQNLLKCCEMSGLEVIEIVFEPLAFAASTITDEEKELGVALIDIGSTTEISIYKDGFLQHISNLPIGGQHFTNDIAIGLRIPFAEAERIKKDSGCSMTDLINDREMIEIPRAGHEKKIPRKHLTDIIQPRAEELMDLIKDELLLCFGYGTALSGVVLTGGGSLLEGIERLAETILGIPVRTGSLDGIRGCRGNMNNPAYATGVGLVLYGSRRDYGEDTHESNPTGILGKMKGWLAGMFKGNGDSHS